MVQSWHLLNLVGYSFYVLAKNHSSAVSFYQWYISFGDTHIHRQFRLVLLAQFTAVTV